MRWAKGLSVRWPIRARVICTAAKRGAAAIMWAKALVAIRRTERAVRGSEAQQL